MIDSAPLSALAPFGERDIERVVYTASVRLDAKDFVGWLDLCAADFTYSIRTFSHEIRKTMVWLEHDHDGMATMIRQLPRHNTDQSNFTRHTTVYTIAPAETGGSVEVVSAVTIYRTELDGGDTKLFAVGKYHDTLIREERGWAFRARTLQLDTRNLGIGTHYPL
jgi:methanesulfonate monooxygenase small subunit